MQKGFAFKYVYIAKITSIEILWIEEISLDLYSFN